MNATAIAVTAPERVELVDVPVSEELASRQLRGRTLCSLMSPGTELACNYHGKKFPSYPGYAAVFEVEEAGDDVSDFAPGDVAFCMGGHRSTQQVDAANAVRVPAGLPPERAVVARLMCVTMTTLDTTRARPGDAVIVSGAGPVGYLAACMFGTCGYAVHVVEPDERRRAYAAAAAGVRATYAAAPLDDADLAGRVALVVECSGHEAAVRDGCAMVRKGGEVALVGVPWVKRTDISAHEILSLVFHKYVYLRSGWEWEVPRHASDFRPHSIWENIALATGWLAGGRIPLEGLIVMTEPGRAQDAYRDALARSTAGLYTVFDWRG